MKLLETTALMQLKKDVVEIVKLLKAYLIDKVLRICQWNWWKTHLIDEDEKHDFGMWNWWKQCY